MMAAALARADDAFVLRRVNPKWKSWGVLTKWARKSTARAPTSST